MPETFTDMSNIDKYRVEQTIRLLYFKHRGDIAKIADESGYDPKLIERIGAKIKRRMRRDADELIAGNITQHILAGAQERTAYLRDAINKFFDNKPENFWIAILLLLNNLPKIMLLKKQYWSWLFGLITLR